MATNDHSNLSYSSAEEDLRDELSSRRNSNHRHCNYQAGDDDRGSTGEVEDEDDFHRRRRPSQQPSERSSSSFRNNNTASTTTKTIALFGASSPTGHHFLRLALDAGYHVRALVGPGTALEDDFDNVTIVHGSLQDAAKVQEVVYSASYVVCMLVGSTELVTGAHASSKENAAPDHSNNNNKYPSKALLHFVKSLYPMMIRQDDPPVQGFLFQATSWAADGHGKTPFLTKVVSQATTRYRTDQLKDLNAVIAYVHSRHRGTAKLPFPYIVTRPTNALRDGPSTKKLAASKSVRTQYESIRMPIFFLTQCTLFLFILVARTLSMFVRRPRRVLVECTANEKALQ